MGQSGATLTRSLSNTSSLASRQQRLSGAASSDSRQQTSAIAAPPAAALAPSSNGLNDDIETLSPSAERKARRAQYEAKLLAQLWLVSAASFRRAVKMDECRIAIQEAERIDPADPDVWVQVRKREREPFLFEDSFRRKRLLTHGSLFGTIPSSWRCGLRKRKIARLRSRRCTRLWLARATTSLQQCISRGCSFPTRR